MANSKSTVNWLADPKIWFLAIVAAGVTTGLATAVITKALNLHAGAETRNPDEQLDR